MSIIRTFEKVRDIPYRIPLSLNEEDDCCSGKHKKLYDALTTQGYEVRYRVCAFVWSSLNLPFELSNVPHDNDCTHTYLEIKIDGSWKILDATWDKLLKIFHINEWDGKSGTEIAVKPTRIFSPRKSLEIVMNSQTEEAIKKDLEINGKFYKGFNEWLDKNRG